jgi:hypothetical protein
MFKRGREFERGLRPLSQTPLSSQCKYRFLTMLQAGEGIKG